MKFFIQTLLYAITAASPLSVNIEIDEVALASVNQFNPGDGPISGPVCLDTAYLTVMLTTTVQRCLSNLQERFGLLFQYVSSERPLLYVREGGSLDGRFEVRLGLRSVSASECRKESFTCCGLSSIFGI